jgi:hypothetical protein
VNTPTSTPHSTHTEEASNVDIVPTYKSKFLQEKFLQERQQAKRDSDRLARALVAGEVGAVVGGGAAIIAEGVAAETAKIAALRAAWAAGEYLSAEGVAAAGAAAVGTSLVIPIAIIAGIAAAAFCYWHCGSLQTTNPEDQSGGHIHG